MPTTTDKGEPVDETDQPLTDDEIWTKLAGAEQGERVDLMLELAERAAHVGAHEQTIALAGGVADAAEPIGRTESQARAGYLAAEAHAALQQTDDALAAYRRAAGYYRSVVDEDGVAACHFRAGWALSEAGRMEEALAEWTTAQHLSEQVPDGDDEVGKAALARADALSLLGRHEEALDALSEARAAFRRHGEATHTAWADDRAAGVLLTLGRTEEAVTWLERCLAVAEAAGEPHALARARGRLAEALRADGRASAAVPHLRRAGKGFRRAGDLRSVASCDLETAICHAELGRPDEADEFFRRARALYDATGADEMVRRVDQNRAVFLWDYGRREESVATATTALGSARDAGAKAGATSLATRLADSLVRLGRPEQAAAVLAEVSEPSAGSGVLERGLWLAVRSRVEALTGERAAAERLATEGIDLVADTSFTTVKARLYEARAEARHGSDPEASDADRARAVALSLAVGDVAGASTLSQPFLTGT